MDPEAVQIFCEEYAAERNRLQAEAHAGRGELEKELRQVTGDHEKLVNAIIAGVPAEQVKDRMIALDARRKEIGSMLATAPAADPLRIHPSMAHTYRDRVGALIRGLSDAEGMEEAKEALRALVETIVLRPDPEGDGLTIELQGALAGLLRLATGQPLQEITRRANSKKASGGCTEAFDNIGELVLVAGTCSGQNLQTQKNRPVGAADVRDARSQLEMVAGARNHLNLHFLSTCLRVLEQMAAGNHGDLFRTAA